MSKIAIDEGHGLKTAGKRCLKSLDPNQTREWVLNHRVGVEVEKYLKSAGHEVLRVSDPDGSSDVSLAKRVKKANDWNADFYLSIHHNWGVGGKSGGGTCVYVHNELSPDSRSPEFQKAIYDNAIKRANLKGNRANGTPSANFYVLHKTDMAAVLIECGFMDSSTDIKYILDAEWSKKMALGIAEGICDVLGGTIKKEEKKPAATPEKQPIFKNGDYNKKVKTTANLNVRSGRGTNHNILGTLPKGSTVEVLYILKAPDGYFWGSVDYGKNVGFIRLDYVSPVE